MKKIFLIFLYCLFLALLAEFGFGYIGYRLTQGYFYSYNKVYEELKEERREITGFAVRERMAADIDQAQQKQKKYRTEILHPYLGYVVDFHNEECPEIGFCDDRMRGYKKLLQGKDFPEAAPNRAIVVITGGSVAYGIANNSSKGKLEQALSTLPGLEDKEIIIYTLALGGYKQPQQLFAIQYYLSMGARFDMIINIDGFNDMVLPLCENIPFGTNPFFPRAWRYRIRRGVEDRRGKALEGMKAYANEQRALLADRVNKNLFRRSSLCNLIWKLRDAALTKKVAQAESEYLRKVKERPGISSELITAGTKFPLDDEQLVLEQIARFWRRSSELLHNVAKAEDIKYYHFLQPNQYVENSKPMNKEERKIAFLEGSPNIHPYAKDARRGYPYLIAQGAVLERSEVAFHDLTMMFQENEEVLYRDGCCHFNTKGYDYIIDEIINLIKKTETHQITTSQEQQ